MSASTAHPRSAPARLHTARSRARVLWFLLGVLLIAGCALGFGVVAQHLAARRPVVVLGRPLERGAVVGPGDLAVAQVGADEGVALVAAADSDALVGRPLLASLPAGALLTRDLVGPEGLAVAANTRTVGLELEPGGYPTSALAEGDVVSVVDTGGAGTILTDDAVITDAAPAVEGAATLLVSIAVDEAAAARIAAAADQDQVRLLLHGAGR